MAKTLRLNNPLTGKRIVLREMQGQDASESYLGWMNDPEIIRWTESRFSKYSISDLKNYIETVNADPLSLFLAITLKQDNRHIGNIKLGPINPMHHYASIGILIGEKSCWGLGYGTEAVILVRDYAFHGQGLHKLTSGIVAPNVGSRRIFEKAGFEMEGVKRQHHYFENEWHDVVLFGFINPNCSV